MTAGITLTMLGSAKDSAPLPASKPALVSKMALKGARGGQGAASRLWGLSGPGKAKAHVRRHRRALKGIGPRARKREVTSGRENYAAQVGGAPRHGREQTRQGLAGDHGCRTPADHDRHH